MRDNKFNIQQTANAINDGYKTYVCTTAGFKVFSPHLSNISKLESLNLGISRVS